MNKKITAAALLAPLAAIAGGAGAAFALLRRSYRALRKLDTDGSFYYLEYTGDYSNALVRAPLRLISTFGCSAFCTHGPDGAMLTGRNYDMPHKDRAGNLTGLNFAVHLHPADGYASVNMADAAWISYLGLPYSQGALDNRKTPRWPLALLPYLCMDGMNEKGLTASILYLDVKDGEKAVHQNADRLEKVTINELTRFIIDSCATVDEAIALAKSYNLVNILQSDYHLFVADAAGDSAVLEWRYNTLTVTRTDACTNFYVGYDDAEDRYEKDGLKERFAPPPETYRKYRCGIGHGYDRFAILVKTLDAHRRPEHGEFYTQLSAGNCMRLLSDAAQEYNGSLTSYTQYSCVYNQRDLTLDVCIRQDYSRCYHLAVRPGEGPDA